MKAIRHLTNLIFLLITFCLFGQDKTIPENFSVDKNRIVVWQKVYETNFTQEEIINNLKKYLENTEFTRNLELNENTFKGYSGEMKVKPIKGGNYYEPITAFITIDTKDNKYRVTLKDIKYKEINVGIHTSLVSINKNQSASFEDFVLKGNHSSEFKTNFVKINFLKSYDTTFEKIFQLTPTIEKKEDW